MRRSQRVKRSPSPGRSRKLRPRPVAKQSSSRGRSQWDASGYARGQQLWASGFAPARNATDPASMPVRDQKSNGRRTLPLSRRKKSPAEGGQRAGPQGSCFLLLVERPPPKLWSLPCIPSCRRGMQAIRWRDLFHIGFRVGGGLSLSTSQTTTQARARAH